MQATTYELCLLEALIALKQGDLSVRLPDGESVTEKAIAETFNALMLQLTVLIAQTSRLCREMEAGRLGGQVELYNLDGAWKELQESVNRLEWTLTGEIRQLFQTAELVLNNGRLTPFDQIPHDELTYLRDKVITLAQAVATEA